MNRTLTSAIPDPVMLQDPLLRSILIAMRDSIVGLSRGAVAVAQPVVPTAATGLAGTALPVQDSETEGLEESMQTQLASAERNTAARSRTVVQAAAPAPGGMYVAQRVIPLHPVCDLDDLWLTDAAGLPLLAVGY